MNEEKMKEVFSDEEFVKEFFSKETPEEAQAMLAEKDIEVSVEDLIKLNEILEKKAQSAEDSEELTDDDLENVAGGELAFCLITLAVLAFTAIVAAIGSKESGQRW